jgi:geranylgeranyl pyrophosphate synthase
VLDGQEREHALKVKPDVALEDYFAMVEAKTSGLFALPMAGAAALCEAPDELVDGLAEAARHMGVLFQIQDDVLDLFGDKGREQRGSDVGEGKRSLLVVHALGLARPAEASWLRAVLDKPRAETSRADIDAVIALLEQRGSLAFALAEMRRRQRNAQAVPAVVAHARLRDLVTGMCELFLKPIAPLFEGRQER